MASNFIENGLYTKRTRGLTGVPIGREEYTY